MGMGNETLFGDNKIKKILLVEDFDCNYCAFENIKDAMKYAVDQIEKSNNTEADKKEMAYELLTSYIDRDRDRFGEGFTVDEFIWCWTIDYREDK